MTSRRSRARQDRIRAKELRAKQQTRVDVPGWALATAGAVGALAVSALVSRHLTKKAERENPPIGRFLEVDGVRLHYIEKGQGEPLVLIHGNGVLIQDFTVNGLVDRLSERYRVIVIDRPGYGYSARPRAIWTPRAHATLFQHALEQLGVARAIVLGHSWGTLVAVSLALQAPELVRSLVLVSGYYFPTVRLDAALNTPMALPVIGDALRHTVMPLAARVQLPLAIKAMFSPAEVTKGFDKHFPKNLMVRPGQLRASAEDAVMMSPTVIELEKHYSELKMPVAIITGEDDRIVDVGRQSRRLHEEIPQSTFVCLPGLGHMVHHLAPDEIIRAIDEVGGHAERTREIRLAAE